MAEGLSLFYFEVKFIYVASGHKGTIHILNQGQASQMCFYIRVHILNRSSIPERKIERRRGNKFSLHKVRCLKRILIYNLAAGSHISFQYIWDKESLTCIMLCFKCMYSESIEGFYLHSSDSKFDLHYLHFMYFFFMSFISDTFFFSQHNPIILM